MLRGNKLKTLVQVSHRLVAGAVAIAIAIVLPMPPGIAQMPTQGPREMPARAIPVPDTVSPQMRKIIAAPLTPTWNVIPNTPEEWKAQVNTVAVAAMQGLPALREALHVKTEPTTIDGVKAFMVSPDNVPPENQNRLLIHVHGGCYVSFPGESGTIEAVWRASDASGSSRSTIACRPITPIQPHSMTQ